MILQTVNRREPRVGAGAYNDFATGFIRAKQRFNQECSCNPAVNIIEEPSRFVLHVAAPGYSKDDFSLNVEKDVLTISTKVSEDKDKEGSFVLLEFSSGSFQRQFSLGKSIDTSKIGATYENGLLKIVLNKKEEAIEKPSRTINVE